MIIGVYGPVASYDLVRTAGHNFIGIHVGRGARSGLIDVQDELLIPLPHHHLPRRGGDGLGDLAVEVAELPVG